MKLLGFLALSCVHLCGADPTWKELLGQGEKLMLAGRYEEARGIAGLTLRAAGPAGLRVAVTLNQIGLIHSYLGEYSQGEKAYLRGIRLLDGCGCEPLQLSRLLDNLASLYLAAGTRHAQAEGLRRRALDLCIAELGPEDPDVGILLSNLGATVMARRRFSEAETLYQRALTILEVRPGPNAASIASVLSNRAVLSVRDERLADALADLTRAVEIHEGVQGIRHPDLVRPLINVARLQLRMDRAALAEAPLRRAVSIAETAFGPEHPIIAEALSTYATALRKVDRKRESREAEKRAQAIRATNPYRAANRTVDIADLLDLPIPALMP